jgi:hypothetical protein
MGIVVKVPTIGEYKLEARRFRKEMIQVQIAVSKLEKVYRSNKVLYLCGFYNLQALIQGALDTVEDEIERELYLENRLSKKSSK